MEHFQFRPTSYLIVLLLCASRIGTEQCFNDALGGLEYDSGVQREEAPTQSPILLPSADPSGYLDEMSFTTKDGFVPSSFLQKQIQSRRIFVEITFVGLFLLRLRAIAKNSATTASTARGGRTGGQISLRRWG